MGGKPVAVVDANVLLNLTTPVVDGRTDAPSGEDPLRAMLSSYDVYAPKTVLGEITEASSSGDLLSAAANAVLLASDHITIRDVTEEIDGSLEYGLDPGESRGIWLANELAADLFVTDEFNTSNYLLVSIALEDRNTLFTSPHVLCKLAERGVLSVEYVNSVLTYLCSVKYWDRSYVDGLRRRYLLE